MKVLLIDGNCENQASTHLPPFTKNVEDGASHLYIEQVLHLLRKCRPHRTAHGSDNVRWWPGGVRKVRLDPTARSFVVGKKVRAYVRSRCCPGAFRCNR